MWGTLKREQKNKNKNKNKMFVRNEKNKGPNWGLQVGGCGQWLFNFYNKDYCKQGSPLSPKIYRERDISSGLFHVIFRLLKTRWGWENGVLSENNIFKVKINIILR